jgi:hypothetical protein
VTDVVEEKRNFNILEENPIQQSIFNFGKPFPPPPTSSDKGKGRRQLGNYMEFS